MDEQRLDSRLFLRLNVLHGLLFGVSWLARHLVPDISGHLPVSTIGPLMTCSDSETFSGVEIRASWAVSEIDSLVWLITVISGAVVLMVPVFWTFASLLLP